MYKRNWFVLIFSTDYHVLITFHCVFHMNDFNCDPIVTSSQIIETHEKQTNVTFSWAKATTIDIERYRTLTFELLKNINLLPAITCHDCNCKSAEHKLQLHQFYKANMCCIREG